MLDFVGYNLFTYSEDFTIATPVWNKYQSSITANVETAPDGTLTGDKLVEGAVSNFHYLGRTNYPITNGAIYNISVFLKQAERTKIAFSSAISGTNLGCRVDLTNGTISDNTFTNTPVVTAEANGWYRVSVTITSGTTSAAPVIRLFPLNALNEINYLGDGTSGFYVWGAQLSQTSTVKTYQKTVAAAGGNGFVTTWYDQSTNANNATQATAANQAQIVASGALILDADTNKVTSTWTSDRYSLASGINTNTQYLSTSMFRRVGTADTLVHLGNLSTTIPNSLLWLGTGSAYSVRSRMPSALTFDNVSIIGRCIMTSLRNASNLKVGYRNGTQLTNTATEAPTSQTLDAFGQTTTSYTSGQYQEYIYWNSEQSANRVGIETDINTYWNAY